MEGYCSTGQSARWAVVPMEKDEEVRITGNMLTILTISTTITKVTNETNNWG